MTPLTVEPHPLLVLGAFETDLPRPLCESPSPPWLMDLLSPAAAAPLRPDESVRSCVRAMLRHGGFKPAGRSKPASEYLVRAAADGSLKPINLVVDACNAVSLHSGLPISVVDLDRAAPPLRVAIAVAGERYVFNPSGQEMDLAGLVCLFDGAGPCANAVKDAQRTKTHEGTRRTLSIVWSCAGHEGRLQETVRWYREILERSGCATAGPIS